MSGYLERIVYEAYAQEYHEDLIQMRNTERLVRKDKSRFRKGQEETRSVVRFKLRVAYIVAIVFLATLLITQVVVATINGNGGGGAYLVR